MSALNGKSISNIEFLCDFAVPFHPSSPDVDMIDITKLRFRSIEIDMHVLSKRDIMMKTTFVLGTHDPDGGLYGPLSNQHPRAINRVGGAV
jgi:hypothetical protein